MFGYADFTPDAAAPPLAPPAALASEKRTKIKDFPPDSSVWSIVCLGELYRSGALAGSNADPVCPVLAFHTFAESPVGGSAYLYTCSTGYLDALLATISNAGFTVTQLSRLQSYLITGDAAMLPPRPLVLTVDDGSQSVSKFFAPRASKRRFPFTLALVTSWLSETPESDHSTMLAGLSDPTMTWDEAKKLFDSNAAEVISHSDGLHYMATELPGSGEGAPAESVRQFLVEKNRLETEGEYERRIRLDMSTSRIMLAGHGFHPPTIFCWPYGEFTQTAKSIARQEGFTHFLLFDTPAVFVSRDSAAEGDLPRVPVLRWDEQVPLAFPKDPTEAQSWWLAFLKVARQSQSRTLLAAALAQLTVENAGHPQAQISRAALEILNGNAAAGSTRLTQLRQALSFDSEALAAIDQTVALYTPRPK